MTRTLSLHEALELYLQVMSQSGGLSGILNIGALEAALAQPRMTFGAADLYPTLPEKAAALCFSLISNHPFQDGNKRIGHAAMELFLVLNGHELSTSIDEQEATVMKVASGQMTREELALWVGAHLVVRSRP